MWICDPDFANLTPVDIRHKQMDKSSAITPSEHLMNRHMLVRRAFDWQEGRLTLRITADDYYKLYINGALLGMGPAQAYPERYNVNEYDLTDHLRPGRNVLAMHVFYMGVITRAWQSGDQRQGLWFELTDEQGRTVLQSDSACRVAFPTGWGQKGLLGYGTQFIEEVSAADIPQGWADADFDDAVWLPATEHPQDDHTLVPQPTPNVQLYTRKPALLEKRGDTWFADMGQEVAGTIQFAAKATSGGSIEIRLGEELNDDGTVRHAMRCNCDYRLTWHLSGRDLDHADFFDYMAFRYVEVHDPQGVVDPGSIGVLVRHYPTVDGVGTFSCGEPALDGIFRICREGVVMGSQEAFLDCPTREKGQYLGDGTITAHSHFLLTGDRRMYRKMLMDFAASAVICPGLMAVSPGGEMQEIADYSCQYPEQVLTYYHLTGDRDTALALMPTVDALEDYFDRYRRDDGLIDNVTDKWNLVDWPANLRDDYDFDLTQPIGPGLHNVINAFYYGLKSKADELRAALGLPCRGESGAVKEAYINAFYMGGGLFRDSEGSQHAALHSVALPLYYGITPADDVPAAADFLKQKGFCCGVYMAYFVLKGLTRHGLYDQAYDMLMADDIHSWRNMLREGATTCWEAWGKGQKWNTSLCHPWASAPVIVLYEDMLGVTFDAGAVSHHPHAPESMGDIDAAIGTAQGPLHVTRTAGQWGLSYDHPAAE